MKRPFTYRATPASRENALRGGVELLLARISSGWGLSSGCNTAQLMAYLLPITLISSNFARSTAKL